MENKVILIDGITHFIAPDAYGVPALWRGLPTDFYPMEVANLDDVGEVAWSLIMRAFA